MFPRGAHCAYRGNTDSQRCKYLHGHNKGRPRDIGGPPETAPDSRRNERARWPRPRPMDFSRGRTGRNTRPAPAFAACPTPGPPVHGPKLRRCKWQRERRRRAGDRRQPGDRRRHRNHQRRARSWLADRRPARALPAPRDGQACRRRPPRVPCSMHGRSSTIWIPTKTASSALGGSAVGCAVISKQFLAERGDKVEATLRRWNADTFHEKPPRVFGHPPTWAWDPVGGHPDMGMEHRRAAIPAWAWYRWASCRHGAWDRWAVIPTWAWDRSGPRAGMGMGPIGTAVPTLWAWDRCGPHPRYGHGTDGSASQAWVWDR